jgi:hypothetical protein
MLAGGTFALYREIGSTSYGGGVMDGIERLLFGRDGGGLLDMILGPSREERGAADRTHQAGQWCGSTPENAPSRWQLGGARGPRLPRNGLDFRDFC